MSEPLRVMLVEDEALILMQLEEMVEDAGHRVVGTAARSQEAIETALRLRPDLVLVDLSLSDGDSGLDVAKALHGTDDVLVVFVTANPKRLGRDLGGAAGVMAKPFSRGTFRRGLAYLEQCIRGSAPVGDVPQSMQMSARFRS